jgi:hypothetical protein
LVKDEKREKLLFVRKRPPKGFPKDCVVGAGSGFSSQF